MILKSFNHVISDIIDDVIVKNNLIYTIYRIFEPCGTPESYISSDKEKSHLSVKTHFGLLQPTIQVLQQFYENSSCYD